MTEPTAAVRRRERPLVAAGRERPLVAKRLVPPAPDTVSPLSDEERELLYGPMRAPQRRERPLVAKRLVPPAPDTVSPLSDEERELLYGPMRAPALPETVESPGVATSVARRSLSRRILGAVGTAMMVVVVALVLLLTLGPRFLPFQTFYIRTGSMRPGLPIGSLVVSTRQSAQDLHVGDVITFNRPGVPGDVVTHRIAAIEQSPTGPVFVTKGDANGAPDAWRVNATGDGWKYAFSVPYVGYAVGYLQSGLAGIGVRGAVIILGTVVALWVIWRSPKKTA